MTTSETVYGVRGSSSPDELVADVRDVRPIIAELATVGVGATVPEQIPALRVAMLKLSGLDGLDDRAAQEVRGTLTARWTDDARYATAPTSLDVAMALLRKRFGEKYDRAPRMGKNRDMEVVGGLPHWAAADLPVPTVPNPAVFEIRPVDSAPGRGLKVGVLDTAMFDNPVLAGRFRSDTVISGKQTPLPTWAGHATFVVGRILRRAPGADVTVRKILGGAYGTATAWELARAMASFLGSGIEVLNLSLGCFTVDDEPPFLIERATRMLLEEMVLVAAAGNHGTKSYPMPALTADGVPQWRPEPLSLSSPMWPAAIDGVVAVGAAVIDGPASAPSMVPADFTPADVPWIDLWAPGVDVVSTYLEGDATAVLWRWNPDGSVSDAEYWSDVFHGFATWSGTSMSAGDVTGEIAKLAQDRGIGAREAHRLITARPGGRTGPDDIRPWI